MRAHRLLLVDPFKNLLNAYHMILEEETFSVDTAFSLKEACQLFEKREYSVLITEYIPPFETTDEVIGWMRENHPETYIIMVTNATIDEKTYERLFALGVWDIILKPYSPAKILVHIRRALEQRDLVLQQRLFEKLSLLEPITEKIEGFVFNAGFFKKCLRQEIKKARRHHHPLSVLLIQLPPGKEMSDPFSIFYMELLKIIQRHTREEDLIGRDNGEIGIILPETDQTGSRALMQRLLGLVRDHQAFQSDDVLMQSIQTLSFQSFTYPEQFSIPEPLKSLVAQVEQEFDLR